MYDRLTQIDELTRPDHYRLDATDNCYYFGEYTAQQGFAYSQTNQLILNFKKKVSLKGEYQYRYKLKAIHDIAQQLDQHIAPNNVTFVPVPPSKAKTDPAYDDRLVQVLMQYQRLAHDVDYRELVSQTVSTEASHNSDDRLSPDQLSAIYQIDEQLTGGIRNHICIFDDMLTTGSHFKAMQSLLRQRFPDKSIFGLFVARRAPEAIDWGDVF